MAKIIISREKVWADSLREYVVMVDGKEKIWVEQGDTKFLEIKSGNHEIYLKIDWCRSNKIKFNISEEEEEVKFKCRGPGILASLFTIVFFIRRIKLVKENH